MREIRISRKSIFLTAWTIMLIYTLFVQSSEFKYILPNSKLRLICSVTALILLLTKMVFFDRFKLSALLLILATVALAFIVSYKSAETKLALYICFIVAASGIDLEDIVKVDIKIRTAALIILMLCSSLGIISNYSRIINETLKIAFGWLHPNAFCGSVVLVVMEWIYLKWERFSFRHLFVITPIFVFLFFFSESRTTLYSSLFVIIWVLLKKKDSRLVSSRLMERIYKWITPLMAALSWAMLYLYMEKTKLGLILNEWLSTRLNWSQKYLLRYGVSLWGSNIETVSTHESEISGRARQIFDMAYIRLPIEYGIVYSVFFLLSFVMIARFLVNNNKNRELMLVLYFSLVGIGSTTTINIFNNYMLLLLFPSISLFSYMLKD